MRNLRLPSLGSKISNWWVSFAYVGNFNESISSSEIQRSPESEANWFLAWNISEQISFKTLQRNIIFFAKLFTPFQYENRLSREQTWLLREYIWSSKSLLFIFRERNLCIDFHTFVEFLRFSNGGYVKPNWLFSVNTFDILLYIALI